jgi:hypothetical protein
LSKLFDRLKNAARLRGRASADHSLLTLALQRAAHERAQSRAANDDVDSRAADTLSGRDAGEEFHNPEAELHDPEPRDPPLRASRRRVARGIAGALALVALVTLVVISLHLAQAPPAPVPVFQLDRTLR